jgi:nitrogen fixation protein FixH
LAFPWPARHAQQHCLARDRPDETGRHRLIVIIVFFFWVVVVILATILLAFIVHWAGGRVLNLRLGHFVLNVGFT